LLSAAGGWYLLDQDTPTPAEAQRPLEVAGAAPVITEVPLQDSTEDPVQEPAEAIPAAPGTDVNAELRKARLATEADILAFPAGQSAVYFYGRVLAADPENAVAQAEFDAVLSRLAQTVAAHLAAEEYRDAYELAILVARYDPEHPLVVNVQQTLDQISGDLVGDAMDYARNGASAEAEGALQQAESLPGRDAQYFAAVRESIADILGELQLVEQERAADAKAATVAATAAWIDKVRTAIDAGQLDSPAGSNAIEYLDELDATDPSRQQMHEEVLAALIASAASNIDSGRLTVAEGLLNSADGLASESEQLAELRTSLESAYIDVEANRLATMEELVRLSVVPARYPRRAVNMGLTGWVEVEFTVTPAGETSNINVTQAEPTEVFDTSAVQAVEQWTFEPRVYRGQTISQRAMARLVFQLE
jgi:TonB family protein